MLVDEIGYVIARHHGISPKEARVKPWEPSELVKPTLHAKFCALPEVSIFRARSPWFDALNRYRNSSFHHGVRHGHGHYDPKDTRAASRAPSMNALFAPDCASLKPRSKPHEWTWNDATTIDDVAGDAWKGLTEFLRELAEKRWNTKEPPDGKMPLEKRPTIMVVLARPAALLTMHGIVVPMYSSEERARATNPFPADMKLELIEVPPSTRVIGQRAFSFWLRELKLEELPPLARSVKIYVDPVPGEPGWRVIGMNGLAEVLPEQLADCEKAPMSIPINAKQLFCWSEPRVFPWG